MSDYENVTSQKSSAEDVKYGGYICALIMGIIAAICIGFNLLMINDSNKYYPKLFFLGIIFLGLTIGFLVYPGYRIVRDLAGYDFKEKMTTVFWKSNIVETIIRIIITLICTGFGIYIMVEEKFYLCGTLTLALITNGAVVLIIKTIVQWIIDASKTVEEKEEIAKDETKYSSVAYRIVCIVIAALICIVCGYKIYEERYSLAFDFGIKTARNVQRLHHEKWADIYLKGDLDKEIPYRILKSEDSNEISIIINVDEIAEEDYEPEWISIFNAPLSKLLSYVMAGEDQRIITFSADEKYSEYDQDSLMKISSVKKYFDKNPVSDDESFKDFELISFFLEKYDNNDEEIMTGAEEMFLEAKDSWCFVTDPSFSEEFIFLWDIPSFTEYYNNAYGTSWTDEELLEKMYSDEYSNIGVICSDVGPALYSFYKKRNYTCGLILDYGTDHFDCYTGSAMNKIVSNLCLDDEFMKSVNEFYGLQDKEEKSDEIATSEDTVTSDSSDSKNWWDEDFLD